LDDRWPVIAHESSEKGQIMEQMADQWELKLGKALKKTAKILEKRWAWFAGALWMTFVIVIAPDLSFGRTLLAFVIGLLAIHTIAWGASHPVSSDFVDKGAAKVQEE
jgi:hypothetical protein